MPFSEDREEYIPMIISKTVTVTSFSYCLLPQCSHRWWGVNSVRMIVIIILTNIHFLQLGKVRKKRIDFLGLNKSWIENVICLVPLTVVVISNYLLWSVMIIKSSLIHQYLPSQTSHMGTNVGIVHFIEPIRRGAEGALINENYRCDWTSLL